MDSLTPLDLNHFICTLGQAKAWNLTQIGQYDTINDFLDYQARENRDQLAIGVPERPSTMDIHSPSSSESLSSDHVEKFNRNGRESMDLGRSSPEKTWTNSANVRGVDVTKDEIDSVSWNIHFLTFQELRDTPLELASIVARNFREKEHCWSRPHHDSSFSEMKLPKCVGLMGRSDRGFLLLWLALVRLGISVLIIMPSCSYAAVRQLCEQCKIDVIYYDEHLCDHHPDVSKLLEASDASFQIRGYTTKQIMNVLEFMGKTPEDPPISFHKVTKKCIAYYHHTSGTSGLPKPIPYSHFAACGALPALDGQDTITFTTTPLYTGGIADCFRSWTSSSTICLAPDDDHPLNTSIIIDCFSQMQKRYQMLKLGSSMAAPKSMYFSCVPMILQMLSQTTKGLDFLRTMKIVGVGGATLPKKDGDNLVSEGINLVSRLGSAECSFLLSSHRHYDLDKDWEYFRVSSDVSYLKFEPLGDDSGRSELVVTKAWPHLAKTNRDNGSWATSDLFEPHPSIPNAWKLVSRRDAQITLLTGKKFDPVSIEEAIKRHPLVKDAFVFGNGQVYPGAIIIKSQDAVNMENESVIDIIWPYLDEINDNDPAHAKIFKDMLVIKPYTHSFAKTAKGTTKRQKSEEDHDSDIRSAYSSDCSISNETITVSLEAVMDIVKKAIGNSIELQDDSEFRAHHIDSVQATRIRSHLNQAFSPPKPFPWNLVYQCGSVRALTEYISRSGSNVDHANEVQLMNSIVEQFGNSLRDNTRASDIAESEEGLKDTIIITGVTGTLGVNIASFLRSTLSTFNIRRIVCLVRARNDHEARKRVEDAMCYHDIYSQSLRSATSKLEYRAVKLEQKELGLSKSVLDDLRRHATTIIHSAWEVNFSIPLKDFNEQFQGLRNLINFSLSGTWPKHLVFCSSTASIANAPVSSESNTIMESIDHDPLHASPLGYSRSKWVAEAICSLACQNTRAKISIIRIGQLSGNTINGAWNEKEAWPLMLSTGGSGCLNSLPALNLPLSWLPVNIAAQAVLDIALRESCPEPLLPSQKPHEALVFHLVNNSTSVQWKHLLQWIGYSRKSRDLGEWLVHAEGPHGLQDNHPARSLLGFWKDMDTNEDLAMKPSFGLLRTRQISPVMSSFSGIDEDSVKKIWNWVQTVAKKWEQEGSGQFKK